MNGLIKNVTIPNKQVMSDNKRSIEQVKKLHKSQHVLHFVVDSQVEILHDWPGDIKKGMHGVIFELYSQNPNYYIVEIPEIEEYEILSESSLKLVEKPIKKLKPENT